MSWLDIDPATQDECPIQAVHAGFWLKPDRLAGGEIRPLKPSQTFSRDPARTGLDEGVFVALAGRNWARALFFQVKMPIEHNGH
jgi:hypothetical protein